MKVHPTKYYVLQTGSKALEEGNKCIGGKIWKAKQVAAMELAQV